MQLFGYGISPHSFSLTLNFHVHFVQCGAIPTTYLTHTTLRCGNSVTRSPLHKNQIVSTEKTHLRQSERGHFRHFVHKEKKNNLWIVFVHSRAARTATPHQKRRKTIGYPCINPQMIRIFSGASDSHKFPMSCLFWAETVQHALLCWYSF